eukprot:GHVU01031023.1.p1 GENE.GHVU01031023.1~~GHVU01031023.1.p1  ORF type:complete len:379 (-),score=57.87 GHVU01031023.1:1849-2985(-)
MRHIKTVVLGSAVMAITCRQALCALDVVDKLEDRFQKTMNIELTKTVEQLGGLGKSYDSGQFFSSLSGKYLKDSDYQRSGVDYTDLGKTIFPSVMDFFNPIDQLGVASFFDGKLDAMEGTHQVPNFYDKEKYDYQHQTPGKHYTGKTIPKKTPTPVLTDEEYALFGKDFFGLSKNFLSMGGPLNPADTEQMGQHFERMFGVTMFNAHQKMDAHHSMGFPAKFQDEPFGNKCKTAPEVFGEGFYPFSTKDQSNDDDESVSAVYWCWTATKTGMTAASTCGLTDNAAPTRLQVYKGCGCKNGRPIRHNRISPDEMQCGINQFADFYAVRGEEYLIRLADDRRCGDRAVTTGEMFIQSIESPQNQKYFDAQGQSLFGGEHH